MHQLPILVLLVATFADVDITLLTDSNLADDFAHVTAFHEDPESQVVVAHIGQGISTIVLTSMEHALMLQEMLDDLEGIGAFQVGEGFNQGNRDELVVFHSLLNRCQHTEVVIRQVFD